MTEHISDSELRKLRHDDPYRAHDAAVARLVEEPGNLFLTQVRAHALAQTGATDEAIRILTALYDAGHRDAETLGLLGRAWKEAGRDATVDSARRDAFAKSRACYEEGLSHAENASSPDGYYPGINAAALSVFLGELDAARSIASRAEKLALAVPKQAYWTTATLAETALILGDEPRARSFYKAAAAFAPAPGQAASTRRQARELSALIFGDASRLDDCFQIAPVVVFMGHLSDAPGRNPARLPDSLAPEIENRIHSTLERTGASVAFSAAARGGDLLFLSAAQRLGVKTQIILPLERDVFERASVYGGGAEWPTRFTAALADAASVRIANTHSSTADGTAFEYGTRHLLGLARLHARQLDAPLRALVVWNGTAGDGHGGTAWAVSHLLKMGILVENLFPGMEGAVTAAPPTAAPGTGDDIRPIRAILFADCKGYSKLRDEDIARYTLRFLAGVRRMMDRAAAAGEAPAECNTWGDGLFLAFTSIRAAGRFAIALRAAALRTGATLDLPEGVCLRIGLHAGPVSAFADPVTGRRNLAGANVAFAARIEPIVPENQICASEPFAALAADEGIDEFRFEYAGATEFAKGFGRHPLYRLLPR